MEQYISKSALVAEIKRRRDYYKRNPLLVNAKYCIDEDNAILKLLDTLEVKEVDLEEEATEFIQTKEFVESKESPALLIAKHFYELGLKVHKGE